MRNVIDIAKKDLEKYLNMHLTYEQIAQKYKCSSWTIMERAKQYGLKSEARKFQMLDNNPSKDPEVQKKISESVKKHWEDGDYSSRINGMQDVKGYNNPNFIGKYNYRDKAQYYHPEGICMCCGKQLSWEDNSLEVHHVNGNHDDITLTNLMPLCRSCHRKYHRKNQPFMKLTKSFKFDSCHYLPYHYKKCKCLHGHTYHMDITVKNVVLQETGMVMDFGILKDIVDTEIIQVLDHNYLNDLMPYPTCELMVTWIWRKLSPYIKGLYSIKVWETDGSCCEFTADDSLQYLKTQEGEWC